MNEYTQYRTIDRFLTPRGNFDSLSDAETALKNYPGGRIEAYNYALGVWVNTRIIDPAYMA